MGVPSTYSGRKYWRIDANPPICDGGPMAGRNQAEQDMSAYVLSRALPDSRMRFARLLDALRNGDQPSFALAELNDLLSSLTSGELGSAVEHADLARLTPYLQNYVAAMVELAAHRRDIPPPAWVRDIEPLE